MRGRDDRQNHEGEESISHTDNNSERVIHERERSVDYAESEQSGVYYAVFSKERNPAIGSNHRVRQERNHDEGNNQTSGTFWFITEKNREGIRNEQTKRGRYQTDCDAFSKDAEVCRIKALEVIIEGNFEEKTAVAIGF